MCGIVGVIGSKIDSDMKKAFTDLLVIDTIRGGDSTGFFMVKDKEIVTAKKAIDGYGFTNMSMYSKRLASILNPTALVGHNRWASRGKITDGNAHPFKCNNTHLIHNGSMITWRLLLKNSDFTDVDSEAICFNVEHEGLAKTISKLNGSFAIVTYNELLGVIEFTRNDKRTLYFAEVKGEDAMLFASEEEMIHLAAARNDIELGEEPWLLQEKLVLSYDLRAKKVLESIQIDDKVKYYKAPAYDASKYGDYGIYSGYGGYGGYGGGAYSRYTPPAKKGELSAPDSKTGSTLNGTSKVISIVDNTTLQSYGVKQGDMCVFSPDSMIKLKNDKVIVIGHLYGGEGHPVDIGRAVMYGRTLHEYLLMKDKICRATVESISRPLGKDKLPMVSVKYRMKMSKKTTTAYWAKHAAFTDTPFDIVEEIPDEKKFFGPDGVEITEFRFKNLVSLGCCMCSDPIPPTPEESTKIAWVYWNEPLCDACTDKYSRKAAKNHTTIDDEIIMRIDECN